MKTPDEIKKGLECCLFGKCGNCPYSAEYGCDCSEHLRDDVREFHQQLEAAKAELLTKVEQLERERDAAVDYLAITKDCKTCKHFPHAASEEPCRSCGVGQAHWEWRGVKEECGCGVYVKL